MFLIFKNTFNLIIDKQLYHLNVFPIRAVLNRGGEMHRRYVGIRYVIRVFIMVFFGTLTYPRLGTLGSFRAITYLIMD